MKKVLLVLSCIATVMIYAQIPANGLVEHFTFNNSLIGTKGSNLATITGTQKGSANFVDDRLGAPQSAHLIDSVKFTFDSIPISNYPFAVNASRTVAFWFKHTSNSTHSFFNYNSFDTTPQKMLYSFAFAYQSGNLILAIADQSIFTEITTPLAYNTAWTHVACTFNGDSAKLYVNGTLAKTAKVSVPALPNGFARIGRSPGNSYYGNFQLDDLLVYDRVLSANEIMQLAQDNSPSSVYDVLLSISTKIYPNPTNNVLNIESDEEIASIHVGDLTGRIIIAQGNLATLNSQIATSELAEGTYFMHIRTTKGKTAVKSFVKE